MITEETYVHHAETSTDIALIYIFRHVPICMSHFQTMVDVLVCFTPVLDWETDKYQQGHSPKVTMLQHTEVICLGDKLQHVLG